MTNLIIVDKKYNNIQFFYNFLTYYKKIIKGY